MSFSAVRFIELRKMDEIMKELDEIQLSRIAKLEEMSKELQQNLIPEVDEALLEEERARAEILQTADFHLELGDEEDEDVCEEIECLYELTKPSKTVCEQRSMLLQLLQEAKDELEDVKKEQEDPEYRAEKLQKIREEFEALEKKCAPCLQTAKDKVDLKVLRKQLRVLRREAIGIAEDLEDDNKEKNRQVTRMQAYLQEKERILEEEMVKYEEELRQMDPVLCAMDQATAHSKSFKKKKKK